MYSRLLHSCSYLNVLFRPVLEILSQGYVKQKAQSSYLPARISLGHFDILLGSARILCRTPGILISLGHVVVLLESAPGILLYLHFLVLLWSAPCSMKYFWKKASGIFVVLGPVPGTLLRSWNQSYKGSSRCTSISSAIRCFVVVFLEVKLNCWL